MSIDIKTMFNTIILASLLIMISLMSVYAVTRTISDTGDNVDTFIRNSNSKYWDATCDGLQLAVWDLNTTGGRIYLPDATISLKHTIYLNYSIDLIGCGITGKSVIEYADDTADCDMFVLNPAIPSFFYTFDSIYFTGIKETTDGSAIVGNDLVNDLNVRNCFIAYMHNDGINLSQAWGLQMDNVVIEYCDRWGAYIGGTNVGATITNCKIVANKNNLYLGTDLSKVINCYIGSCNTWNLYLENADYSVVSGNTFLHNNNALISSLYLNNCDGCSVSGNCFHEELLTQYCIKYKNLVNSTIFGNVFYGYTISAIDPSSNSINCEISNNIEDHI